MDSDQIKLERARIKYLSAIQDIKDGLKKVGEGKLTPSKYGDLSNRIWRLGYQLLQQANGQEQMVEDLIGNDLLVKTYSALILHRNGYSKAEDIIMELAKDVPLKEQSHERMESHIAASSYVSFGGISHNEC